MWPRFDPDSLKHLDGLLGERHVTRAAARVGLTQSAMSRSLAKLRAQLGDALLVAGGAGGMVLTSRAEALRAPASLRPRRSRGGSQVTK